MKSKTTSDDCDNQHHGKHRVNTEPFTSAYNKLDAWIEVSKGFR
jgi:hypothetical protein